MSETDPTPSGKRVLVLTKVDVTSPRDGGSLRTRAVVDGFRTRGAEVSVLAARDTRGRPRRSLVEVMSALPLALQVLREIVRWRSLLLAKWFSFGLIVEISCQLSAPAPAALVIDHSYIGIYRVLLNGPWVLSTHNIEHELVSNYASSTTGLKRWVARREARILETFEARLLRESRETFVVSEHDAVMARGMGGPHDNVEVAPNGVPDGAFDLVRDTSATVVFIGHLGWRPNIDAAVWLVRDVWPAVMAQAPGLRLQIIGRSPAKDVLDLASDTVEVVGDVESVMPYLQCAAVATAPLLAAGGTRIKILEALACGVPVTSTSLGALGLDGIDGSLLRVHDEASAFARSVVELALSRADLAPLCRASVSRFRWSETVAPIVRAVLEDPS